MENLETFHDIVQRMQLNTMHHPTTQQEEKVKEAPKKK
jgi:hypothetical protein